MDKKIKAEEIATSEIPDAPIALETPVVDAPDAPDAPALPWAVNPAPFPVTDSTTSEVVEGAISAPIALETPVVEKVKANLVTVTVPVKFDLTIDANTVITIHPGIQEMDESHANHWYALANGVVIYVPEASE